jgi:hypothetical protein
VRHVDIAGCSFLAAPTRQLAGTNSSSGGGGNSKTASPASTKSGKGKKGKQAGKQTQQGAAVSSKPQSAVSTKATSSAATGRSGKGTAAAAAAAAAGMKQIGGPAGSAAATFSVREPDGCYTLDLAVPSDRQVCLIAARHTAPHVLPIACSACRIECQAASRGQLRHSHFCNQGRSVFERLSWSDPKPAVANVRLADVALEH